MTTRKKNARISWLRYQKMYDNIKSCTQRMAKLLPDSKNLEPAGKAYELLIEVKEAVQRSTQKLRMLRQRLDFMQSGSDASSASTGGNPGQLWPCRRRPRLPAAPSECLISGILDLQLNLGGPSRTWPSKSSSMGSLQKHPKPCGQYEM
jgi:hypothetical protein